MIHRFLYKYTKRKIGISDFLKNFPEIPERVFDLFSDF